MLSLLIVVGVVLAVNGAIGRIPPTQVVASEAPVPPTIRVAQAIRGPIGFYVQALGTVTPLASVNLYSQVSGRVLAVHFQEGQMVHSGEALIDIDPRPYQAQVREARGALQHDQALLAQAEMDLSIYKSASAQQVIARQTYQDQEHIVAQYRGTVENDIGQLEYAQVQLSYCHLTSPINGRVGLRLVDPGNTVFAGSATPIVVITQLQPISVVFNVAENDLSQVREEILHRSALPVDAFDRTQMVKLATGRLLTLDNQIDTSTGTLRFRGEFANENIELFPNQFVMTRMLVKTLQDAILVPTAAVQRNGTQAYVYVLDGDSVRIRPVVELTTENDLAAVTGLQEGDVVSISGFENLQDGTKVRATPAAQTQSSSLQTGAFETGSQP